MMSSILFSTLLLGSFAAADPDCSGRGVTWGPDIGPPPTGCKGPQGDGAQGQGPPQSAGAGAQGQGKQAGGGGGGAQGQGPPQGAGAGAQGQGQQGGGTSAADPDCSGRGVTWGPDIGPPPTGCKGPQGGVAGTGAQGQGQGKQGGGGGGGMQGKANGNGGGGSASTGGHAATGLGNIGKTTTGGTSQEGDEFYAGEDIFGCFEAGFGTRQNGILEGLGCESGEDGHVAGGIDTHTAEQMVAHQCGITLPRWEGAQYVSLLDTCGGHTRDYHFHERLSCLYEQAGAHSDQVGETNGGQPIYGKWEDADNQVLPELDACGGHWGRTPESPDVDVYHYHVQGAAPFTVGCIGPNDDDSLVTVEQCRAFYPSECDGVLVDVVTTDGTKQYDLWCPCYDASGSNTGVNIDELAVFKKGALEVVVEELEVVAEESCSGQTKSKTCKKVAGCEWKKGQCTAEAAAGTAPSCSAQTKSKTCKKVAGCEWKNRKCTAEAAAGTAPSCSTQTKYKTCKKVAGCEWKNRKCTAEAAAGTAPSCSAQTKDKTCKKVAGCEWKKGQCTAEAAAGTAPSCSAQTKYKTCKKVTGCKWNQKEKTCEGERRSRVRKFVELRGRKIEV